MQVHVVWRYVSGDGALLTMLFLQSFIFGYIMLANIEN